ncbi:ATP-binding protein [Adhaeribacter aquaticus]|uniref:ATP-binding protein n=1 Tax=Adhaeribacter aquaticus TaxID=299567 RepID=UPI0004795404|nr:ATP-binding protein [Adhaeribacter aquaticus]
MSSVNTSSTNQFLAGGGEMGSLIRSYNWSETSLGPAETWPQSLKTAVGMMLNCPYPTFVWWGREMIMFHNDAYVPVLGKRHPEALGKSGPVVWADVWEFIGPLMNAVLEDGQPSYFERQLLTPERKGFKEETYFTFSYSPIPDDTGGVGGIFCVCSEETSQVINQRRLTTIQNLSEIKVSDTLKEVYEKWSEQLSQNPQDLPFGLFYQISDEGKSATLAGAFGLPVDAPAAPLQINLNSTEEQLWPLYRVQKTGNNPVIIDNLAQHFNTLPRQPWDESPSRAFIIPVKKASQNQLIGYFIAAISPRLEFDAAYKSFLELVSTQLANAITNVSAIEEERQRLAKMVALDQAKTNFFNNVSHEFRTPLTLILGPLQDIIKHPSTSLSEADHKQLKIVYQNSLRLLKLVNTLLDFSRTEAKRAQVFYEPMDICSFTSEIASAFEPAMTKAGLTYQVICESGSEPVYVDPEIWEKIVLNLLSNAFKFTLAGQIVLKLQETPTHVRLSVQDTGVGIPTEELPNVFNRFHRIQNGLSRTHEGTGIGLALVKELVELHGGTIEVASTLGEGTTFTVSIPKEKTHLNQVTIKPEVNAAPQSLNSEAFVNEANLWNSSAAETEEPLPEELTRNNEAIEPDKHIRILVADDNADMLQYLKRILSPYWQVKAVKNGLEALAAVRQGLPDLVITDVMMPNMNGFELLSEIRKDSNISQVPVIMLSARAGEEAILEGLEKGANDYLLKPFSAPELLARVKVQLEIKRTRQDNAILKRTEGELKKFKLMSDYAFDAFILMREDGSFAYLNDLALQRWGYTREEALNVRVPDVDPNHQEDKFNEVFALAQKQGALPTFETLHKRKDGSTYPVEVSMGGITLDGEPHMFAVARDITRRKQSEQALSESEDRFRTFANNIQNLAWMAKADGYTFWYNQRWYDYTGTTFADMEGAGWSKVIHPDHVNRVSAFVQHALSKGKTWELTFPIRGTDGNYRWFLTRAYEVKDADGQVVRWIGTNTDIQEQKKAEEELQKKNKELQKINSDLDTFIYTASHDLKAPITNIEGLVATLVEDLPADYWEREETQMVITMIRHSIGRFRNTISDLTELTKLQRDAQDDISLVQLPDIFEEVCLDLNTALQESGATFEVDFSQISALRFSRKNMRSILYNLVSNAVKYRSPDRKPFVRIATKVEQNFCVLSVKDNGLGIHPSQENKIFDMFKRLHDHVEGSGIGLYIVKKIVEDSGGRIELESQPEVGSTFKVYFALN